MNTQTQDQHVIFSEKFFTNSLGEELSLQEISKKEIFKIVIGYMTFPIKIRQSGITGFFSPKKKIQEERKLTVTDSHIGFHVQNPDLCSIRFSSKETYEKLKDYDENTIFKRYIMTLILPYQINFHPGNILEIDWR